MIVPVTVFRLPHGQQHEDSTELPDSVQAGYQIMVSRGLRLTAEILSTGQVSLCVEHPELGDVECAVVSNGPRVQAALARMLNNLTVEKIESFIKEMS